MAIPIIIEMRRSGVRWVLPGIAVVATLLVFSRSGWQWDWKWAASWSAGITVVLSSLVAGVVAHSAYYRVKSLGPLVASTPNGVLGILAQAVFICGGAIAGWMFAVALALVRAGFASGVGSVGVTWVLIHAASGLVSAAAFGLMVGCTVRHVLTGPLAAMCVYALSIFFKIKEMEIFSAGGAGGSLFGLRFNPHYHQGYIALGLVIIFTCVLIAVTRLRPVGMWTRVTAACLAALTVLGVVGVPAWTQEQYFETDDPPICVGEQVQVCGPQEAKAVLALSAKDLSVASIALEKRGLEARRSYEYILGRPSAGSASTDRKASGLLQVTVSDMTSNHLDSWAVATTLATPTACVEYWADIPPDGLLDGQGRFAIWVDQVLAGTDAPADLEPARATYEGLKACDPSLIPAWDIDQR